MKRKSINRVNARVRGFVHENASLKWIHVNALDFFDNSITYYSSFIHDQHWASSLRALWGLEKHSVCCSATLSIPWYFVSTTSLDWDCWGPQRYSEAKRLTLNLGLDWVKRRSIQEAYLIVHKSVFGMPKSAVRLFIEEQSRSVNWPMQTGQKSLSFLGVIDWWWST